MKNMLLIGQFNSITKNISREFNRSFHVQLCPDDVKTVEGMFSMMSPDIVLLSTMDMTYAHKSIFQYLMEKHGQVPVLCLGTGEELSLFEEFLGGKQFETLQRPVVMRDITEKIYMLLHMEADRNDGLMQSARRKCILAIDDSAVQLRTIHEFFKDSYDVLLAKSGKESLTVMEKGLPDLILLDYDMPDCDGKETLEMLRQQDFLENVPVVFLTGVKKQKQVKEALVMGPERYLLKPVDQDTLLKTVQELIG